MVRLIKDEREAIERLNIASKETNPGEEVTVLSDDLKLCLTILYEALRSWDIDWKER